LDIRPTHISGTERISRPGTRLAFAIVAAAMMAISLAGCGGKKSSSSSTTTDIAVSISPLSATLQTKQTQQFTSTVTGTSSTAVTWQVSGVNGGNATFGTIDTNGLYTAPAVVPTPSNVTVSAILTSDTTKIGSANVTITNSGLPVVVTPATVTVTSGGQQTFVATVGAATISPGWSVHCSSLVAGGCGTITNGGVYTAPLAPPPGGTVSIVAVTPDNTALVGTASVTVNFGNGSLRGSYVFSLTGARGAQPFAEIGTLTFDGGGKVTAGGRDTFFGGLSFHSDASGGTYQVGTDGRGTVTAAGMTWQVLLIGFGHAMALELDSDGTSATGTLDVQSPGEFQLASLVSNYTLATSGTQSGSAPWALVGGIALDGAGKVTTGTLDVNGSTSVSGASVTGTISAPSASGSGALSLSTASGPFAFTYYMIDAAHIKVVENDINGVSIGELVRQGSAVSTTSLRNSYAFTANGPVALGPFAAGGVMTLDGAGTIASGVSDNLGNGQLNAAVTGTYTVANAGTGRVTATVGLGTAVMHWVMYPRLDGALDFIRIDAGAPIHGTAVVQTAGPFDPSLQKGPFAALLSASSTSTAQAEDAIGQLALSGGSAFNSTLTLDDAGTLQTGISVLAGGYLVARDTGRGTTSLTSSNARLNGATLYVYQVDSHTALLLLGGSAHPMSGLMQQQF
jgi:hypothetical protein